MMTKPTRFLLSSILQRSQCSSHFLLHSSRRLFCDLHTQEEKDPTFFKYGDRPQPRVVSALSLSPEFYLNFDLGRWLVKCGPPGYDRDTTHYQQKELYDIYLKTVTAVVGSEKEAKERIYLISDNTRAPGFGIYADKKLADKLKDVDGVLRLTPDYFEEARDSDPETCFVSM
ncbi:hypothetical protein FRX31_007216 [Thalictrum thalictroides]|uniref:MORF/ORRM1/DAG-like MORF domain-containing protein n=1 Tax=Thalictrum thalictroides TaxID=46969 RepID=A0A7J6X1H6_THATH|nr:hypothetical protein FRX31_007216 [Thalictrum thalictroides]